MAASRVGERCKLASRRLISGIQLGIVGLLVVGHSARKAMIGSTFVARRAGIQQANSATLKSSSAITTNVKGSVGRTPNNKLSIQRVSANAASKPIAAP